MVKTEEFGGWLAAFTAALNARDVDAVAALFAEDCYWRDLVAFSWNIATMEGRAEISAMLRAQLDAVGEIATRPEGEAKPVEDRIEGWFDFETKAGRGKGFARLRDGKCWTLLTSLTELKGFEEPS